jgi:hypothetical protein
VTDFIQRIVNDFGNTLAEFKQLAATLKETGKIQQPGLLVPPSADPIKTVAAAASDNTSNLPGGSVGPGRADTVTTGVEINSTPSAKFYIDGKFQNSNTPSKVPLSVGEHTVRLMRCGYKIWEQKIRVEEGTLTTLKPVLEKQ